MPKGENQVTKKYRITIIGPQLVGKTSYITRLVGNHF